jgi:hypothetical protein
MNEQASFSSADERMHRFDPSDWSWNESWYFSWIDLAGGPAGFLRVGVLPNQRRAILWCYVHRDGAWLGTEETRLALDDIDLANGLSYDWTSPSAKATRQLRGQAGQGSGPGPRRDEQAHGSVLSITFR